MGIAETRDEIIRLIERMQPSRPPGRPRAALGRRDRSLQTQRLAIERLEARMLALHKSLQARVAGLEARIASAGAPSSDPVADQVGGAGASLGGRIREGLLADILQLVAGSMMSGLLRVDLASGGFIEVHFHEGDILHAAAEDGTEGEEAFFRTISASSGTFYFHDRDDKPPRQTIDGNAQFLILEGLRRADEAAQAGGEAGERDP